MGEHSTVFALVGVIVIIGVLVVVFSSDINTSGKAVAPGNSAVAVTAVHFNEIFSRTKVSESLPENTAVKVTVYLTDESNFKEFFVEQGGASEYSGEEYELGLEIWQGTFSSLYHSNDLCAFKDNIYKIEKKASFKLLKYVAARNLCS